MHRPIANLRHRAICLVLLATATVPGCCCCPWGHKSCNDITPGAIPQPNGTYACQWVHAEKARADQDKFVIYQYEWSADGTALTPYGQRHVAQLAQELCQVPYPIVIEPSSDHRMDDSHRTVVLEAIANSGNPVTPDRVILGRSEAEGLYGQEAPGVSRGMFSSQTGGQGIGNSTLGTGAAHGGSLGGVGTTGGSGVGMGLY